MNPTPERALELAEYMLDDMNGDVLPGGLVATEVAAVCRAYADLSRKWQAVLNAGPVALIEWSKSNVHGGVEIVAALLQPAIAGAQLIIKPTA